MATESRPTQCDRQPKQCSLCLLRQQPPTGGEDQWPGWVYDTLDHQIGGFSQQQGAGGSILFTSQYGTVNLATLPVVSIDGRPQTPRPVAPPPMVTSGPITRTPPEQETDIFSAIERLGDLRAKGILTEEEFQNKKAELLGRL